MEELVNLVMQKTGLPKATAQTAVNTVLDFLKKKLPPQFAGMIDSFISGKGELGAAEGLLGGLLGGRKK